VSKQGTRQRSSLPSVIKQALGKELLCRVPKKKHSAKSFFAECLKKGTRQRPALGKEALCRVPEKKHSAKYLTLGKDLFSGSELILISYKILLVRLSASLLLVLHTSYIVGLSMFVFFSSRICCGGSR
jgi:hypothetical protein